MGGFSGGFFGWVGGFVGRYVDVMGRVTTERDVAINDLK